MPSKGHANKFCTPIFVSHCLRVLSIGHNLSPSGLLCRWQSRLLVSENAFMQRNTDAGRLAGRSFPMCLRVVWLRGYVWDTKVLLHCLYQNPPYGPVTYGLKTRCCPPPNCTADIQWWSRDSNYNKTLFQKGE